MCIVRRSACPLYKHLVLHIVINFKKRLDAYRYEYRNKIPDTSRWLTFAQRERERDSRTGLLRQHTLFIPVIVFRWLLPWNAIPQRVIWVSCSSSISLVSYFNALFFWIHFFNTKYFCLFWFIVNLDFQQTSIKLNLQSYCFRRVQNWLLVVNWSAIKIKRSITKSFEIFR